MKIETKNTIILRATTAAMSAHRGFGPHNQEDYRYLFGILVLNLVPYTTNSALLYPFTGLANEGDDN